MFQIVPDILSLVQHLEKLKTASEKYRIEKCPTCGCCGLWHHGERYRKSDRENRADATLNPIPILRFYCPACHHTCSALPECIPPRRWYLWSVQCAVMLMVLSGITVHKASTTVLPSRWTIRRWLLRFKNQFSLHSLQLRSVWSWLGYCTSLREFWSSVVDHVPFSTAMMVLHHQGVVVP